MKRYTQILLLLSSLLTITSVNAEYRNEVIIAGWLETIILSPWQIKLRAKLDSGAKTSSIHAENIKRFQRDGKIWLRFDLPKGQGKKAIQHTIEAPLIREAQIKRHNMSPATRSVVELSFCIDANYYTTQFTLADRGNYNYPVLLGRRFLSNNILVDSAAIFTHSNKYIKNNCTKPELKSDQFSTKP